MLVVDPPLLRKCRGMGPIGARCPHSIVPIGLGVHLGRGERFVVILEGELRELVSLGWCARCSSRVTRLALGVVHTHRPVQSS